MFNFKTQNILFINFLIYVFETQLLIILIYIIIHPRLICFRREGKKEILIKNMFNS